jgi:aryl carrier-like protein
MLTLLSVRLIYCFRRYRTVALEISIKQLLEHSVTIKKQTVKLIKLFFKQ